MSIHLMSQVWDLCLGDSDKLVLLALADNANDEGFCWPSINTIARKCSKDARTIQRVIKRLEESGHISHKERSGSSNMWSVHPRHDATPARCHPGTSAPPPPAPCRPSPRHDATLTIKEPSKNRKKGLVAPDWVPQDIWVGFLEMRRDIRKPLTDRGFIRAISELEKLRDAGEDIKAVISQSVVNEWRGFFPVKKSNGYASQRADWAPPC